MKNRENMNYKVFVFYLQSMDSLEGPGRFFSSADLVLRPRRYAATLPLFKKGHSHGQCFFLFSFI